MEENKSIYLTIGFFFLFVCFGLARLLCTFCITFTLFSWLRTPNSTGSRWALETSESMQLEPDPLLDNLHLQTVTLHSHSSSSASSERFLANYVLEANLSYAIRLDTFCMPAIGDCTCVERWIKCYLLWWSSLFFPPRASIYTVYSYVSIINDDQILSEWITWEIKENAL